MITTKSVTTVGGEELGEVLHRHDLRMQRFGHIIDDEDVRARFRERERPLFGRDRANRR
jgi:hypothetical protein